jgi:hypothetical protein
VLLQEQQAILERTNRVCGSGLLIDLTGVPSLSAFLKASARERR